MNIEELKAAKKRRGYTLKQIAEKANLPLRTVENIFMGANKPHAGTLQAVETALGLGSAITLEEDERRLLDAFCQLTPPLKETVIEMCESLAAQAVKAKRA